MEQLNPNQVKTLLVNLVGGNRSDYSVSCRGNIEVKLKDWYLSRNKAREILCKFEMVRRCEATGEILGGGNRFVFVEYKADVPIDLVKDLETYVDSINFGEYLHQYDKINIFSAFLFDRNCFDWLQREDIRSLIVNSLEISEKLRTVLS